MIAPSIGRVVWFTPHINDSIKSDQKMAALVTYVHGNECVNLAVFDANGNNHSRCSVHLLQDDVQGAETGYYAEWMPFQKGQAAKYDADKK